MCFVPYLSLLKHTDSPADGDKESKGFFSRLRQISGGACQFARSVLVYPFTLAASSSLAPRLCPGHSFPDSLLNVYRCACTCTVHTRRIHLPSLATRSLTCSFPNCSSFPTCTHSPHPLPWPGHLIPSQLTSAPVSPSCLIYNHSKVLKLSCTVTDCKALSIGSAKGKKGASGS